MAKKRKASKPKKSVRSSRRRGPSSASRRLNSGNVGLKPGVLVRFRPDESSEGIQAIANATGLRRVAATSDFEGVDAASELLSTRSDVKFFERLGIAVIDADEEQAASLFTTSGSGLAIVEPEPIFMTTQDVRLEYLRGFRDAADGIYTALLPTASTPTELLPDEKTADFEDTRSLTWGLYAAGVDRSPYSGAGVRVAVLDTGFDLDHPDFAERVIVSESFIPGESVQDENGHGTHCVGTACGPRAPASGRGYGVAHEAEIFVGKVLSNRGASLGRSTVAGIEWAIEQQVDIVSMSLGGLVLHGQPHSAVFEDVGQAANEEGILLVAAAGNDSRRAANNVLPVNSPANCPSFMAIGAVDRNMRMADFSNRGVNPNGGEIDLVGPGVEVYSSAPEPAPPRQPPGYRQWTPRYDTISGTSMATPHVAGVAALWKQAEPTANPDRLRRLLRNHAKPLQLPEEDIGTGLVQAPTDDPSDRSARIKVIG